MTQTQVCLTMCVKDEAHSLQYTINSLKGMFTHYAVVDTGSSDNTIEELKNIMGTLGIPGKIISRPWEGFAIARNQAIALAEEVVPEGWVLMWDAGDIWAPLGKEVFSPSRDVHVFTLRIQDMVYTRPSCWKASLGLRYKGVLHEYLDQPKALNAALVSQGEILPEVSESRDGTGDSRQKYLGDAEILEAELAKMAREDDPLLWTRYQFYCAQSYRDAQEWDKAIKWYQERALSGGWVEEVWYSLYMIGSCLEKKGALETALSAYLRAWEYRPTRLEAPYALIQLLRRQNRNFLAYHISVAASSATNTDDQLFVEKSIWDWKWSLQAAACRGLVGDISGARQILISLTKSRTWWNIPGEIQYRITSDIKTLKRLQAEQARNRK